MSKAIVALALLEEVAAFQAPAMKASTKAVKASMFEEGDIGVLPPLGVYDPRGDARLPPRHPHRVGRALPGLHLGLGRAQVHRRAGGLHRLARGRADARLAADH